MVKMQSGLYHYVMASVLFIKRCLVGAGISFLIMATVCILIYQKIFQNLNYGVSDFGSVSKAFVPYFLGFELTIIFTALVAKRLLPINRQLSAAFWSIATCMSGIAVTSYSL